MLEIVNGRGQIFAQMEVSNFNAVVMTASCMCMNSYKAVRESEYCFVLPTYHSRFKRTEPPSSTVDVKGDISYMLNYLEHEMFDVIGLPPVMSANDFRIELVENFLRSMDERTFEGRMVYQWRKLATIAKPIDEYEHPFYLET